MFPHLIEKRFLPALAIGAALWSGLACAQPSAAVAPDVLLKGVTTEALAILRQDIAGAVPPARAAQLLESRVLPLFNFPRMTSIAMARNWRLASQAQQEALTAEFKILLVRSYSVALSSYRDERIEYLPLRAGSEDEEVRVRSTIRRVGEARLNIDYEMERTPDGWKIFDVSIAGVSLMLTFRDSFAELVREVGVAGLLKALSEKNRNSRLASG